MLNKVFDKNNNLDGLIFHSDQRCNISINHINNKGIKQSMSGKGNSMDNGMMENFFGYLKLKCFMTKKIIIKH